MTVTTVDAGPRKIARAAEVNAPAAEIFELVADPRRHHELDGGGTVQNAITGPDRLAADAKFSVQMKQYGFPYKITSKVIDFADGTVVEWQHPLGHSWRWELKPLTDNTTLVTETFDYSRHRRGEGKRPEVVRHVQAQRRQHRSHPGQAPGEVPGHASGVR